LLRRRKHRGRRVNDETGSVISIGSSVQQHVPNPRALESEANGFAQHGSYSTHKHRTLGLEHLLVVSLLAAALGLSLQKGAYAESALVGVAALVLLVAQLVRAFSKRKGSHAALTPAPSVAGEVAAPVHGLATAAAAASTVDMALCGVWLKDSSASDPMTTACDLMALNGMIRMAVNLVKGIELHIHPPHPAPPEAAAAAAAPAAATSAPAAALPAPSVASATSSTGAGQQHGGQDAARALAAAGTAGAAPKAAAGGAGGTAAGAAAGAAPVFEMVVFSVVGWFKVRERYSLGGDAASWNRRDLRRGKHLGRACVVPGGGVRLELEWGAPHGGRGHDEFRLESASELHVTSHLEVNGRKHTYTTVYRRKK